MNKFKVGAAGVGQRTDVFISSMYPKFARSSLVRLFDENLVKVNSKVAKAGQKLRPGDNITVDDSALKLKPPTIKLPVIYEDDDVVVINKPAGVLTHSKGALNTEPTVASFLSSRIIEKDLTGNRAGIAHRLDRATSGVIIGAKNRQALEYLQKQFSNHKTKKSYLAVVDGWPEPSDAIIDAPIGRNQIRPQTFRVSPNGKSSQTAYHTIKQFTNKEHRYSLLELNPVTGRTHQLRVHLKYVNHPIVGDVLYGRSGKNLLLHAHSLELTLPSGRRKIFYAEIPPYISKFVGND